MKKVQLLASFHGREATVSKRGHTTIRATVRHVHFACRGAQELITCSCGGPPLVYSPTEHDVDSLRILVLNLMCPHIEALYRGDIERGHGVVTALGREMFAWIWAQTALERSR